MEMPLCDLCNASVESSAKRFTSSEFKSAVNSGLRPPETALQLPMMFGMSKSDAEQQWIVETVMPDNTDWLLCSSCASQCNKYLAATAEKAFEISEYKYKELKAIQAIKEEKDSSGVDYVIDLLLNAYEDYVRWHAARALGEIQDSRAIRPLITALDDDSFLVARYALKALRQFEEEEAITAIKQYEEKKRISEIKSRRKSLKQCKMCGKSLSFLAKLLEKKRHLTCIIFKDEILPEKVSCPDCGKIITLSEKERRTFQFDCPTCGDSFEIED